MEFWRDKEHFKRKHVTIFKKSLEQKKRKTLPFGEYTVSSDDTYDLIVCNVWYMKKVKTCYQKGKTRIIHWKHFTKSVKSLTLSLLLKKFSVVVLILPRYKQQKKKKCNKKQRKAQKYKKRYF